jgi:cohesin loading factor subunit SCC2
MKSGLRLDPVPTAMLQPWYSLVREKRATRQEFLKAVVKALDVDASGAGTPQVCPVTCAS